MEKNKNVTLDWLRKEFLYCNHPKYRKYVDEWLSNLTISQIEGFESQRISKETKSKCI